MKKLVKIVFFCLVIYIMSVSGRFFCVSAIENEAASAAKIKISETKSNPYENDPRVKAIKMVLKDYDSPMVAHAKNFVAEADKYGLDFRLVAAIAGTESAFGKYIPPGSYNGWGWGIPTGHSSGIAFSDWNEGIHAVTEGLKIRYINQGAVSIYQIGNIYAQDPNWASKVLHFSNKITAYMPEAQKLSLL